MEDDHIKRTTRQYPRICIDLEVYQVSNNVHFIASLQNISAGGALLLDPLIPVWGSPELDLEIKLPERATPLKTTGRVVRDLEKDGHREVGIEFVDLSDEQRTILEEFVAHKRGLR